jgi:hypothetical protein
VGRHPSRVLELLQVRGGKASRGRGVGGRQDDGCGHQPSIATELLVLPEVTYSRVYRRSSNSSAACETHAVLEVSTRGG